MNVASYEQRLALTAHRQTIRVKRSRFARTIDAVRTAPPHVKAAVLIVAYFIAFGFFFQASRAEFENKGLAYLSAANRSGQPATSTSTQSTQRPVQTLKPTPTPTQPSQTPNPSANQSGLPPFNNDNENAPSQSIQYTSTGYAYGQCTFYVAKRRPIPQNWGNARDWLTRARLAGYQTGKYARPGAIAQTTVGRYGHVAYVERVEEDGRVYVSEMNYVGWNRISYRWVNQSEFNYIY